MTDNELRELMRKVELVAIKSGPLHGAFDVISAAELNLRGKDAGLTREQIERGLQQYADTLT